MVGAAIPSEISTIADDDGLFGVSGSESDSSLLELSEQPTMWRIKLQNKNDTIHCQQELKKSFLIITIPFFDVDCDSVDILLLAGLSGRGHKYDGIRWPMHSAPAVLLGARIRRVLSLLAPCGPGASAIGLDM